MASQTGFRKPRRTKVQLEEDLLNGLERLVTKMGFTNIPLYLITQEAEIDSNVFYRRYDNINELFALLARKYELWTRDLASEQDLETLGDRKFLISILQKGFLKLSNNKVMQKLLMWELSESNEVTRHTSVSRDKSLQYFTKHYAELSRGKGVDMRSAITILVAAVYYITLYRNSLSVNTTMAFNSSFGDKEILHTLDLMVNLLFDRLERGERLKRRITLMLEDGLHPDDIQRYLEISPCEYEFILA